MLRRAAQLLHIALEMAAGVVVLLAVAVGGLAWRLSQGPLDLAWVARRIEAVAQSDGGTSLVIGHAALAWEGWRRGVDVPLDLRLDGLRAQAADGTVIAAIPQASVSLSPFWLLVGRVVPRAVEVDGARLRVLRAEDGSLQLDLGTLGEDVEAAAAPEAAGGAAQPNPFDALLASIGRPPGNDIAPGSAVGASLSQLRRVLIRDAQVTVRDRQLGAEWSAPQAEIDLRRDADGALSGTAEMQLALGDTRVRLSGQASVQPGDEGSRLDLQLGEIRPAALAQAAPLLAPLARLDAPLSLGASLVLGPHLGLREWHLRGRLGAGHMHLGTSDTPLLNGEMALDGGADGGAVEATLHLPGSATNPTLHLHATAARADAMWALQLAVGIDRVEFADLPALWPAGIDHGARDWVTENVTDGTAHDAHVEAGLTAAADFSHPRLVSLAGEVQGERVTAHWLRPVPPIENGRATLTLDGPDSLLITAHSGQQGGLVLRESTMRIDGLAAKDQVATINANVDGKLADALGLLRQPRLHLFDRHPLELRDPAGTGVTSVHVTVPLEKHVTMDQVGVTAQATLSGVHLSGLVAGRDLDDGELTLAATDAGLTVRGKAALGGIPVDLSAAMDFRAGGPGDVTQRAQASGRASDRQLAAAGLDVSGVVQGNADLKAAWQQRRNGRADITLHADLLNAAVHETRLGWSKPAGRPAVLDARLLLDRDHLVGVDQMVAQGDGMSLVAHAEMQDGHPSLLRIEHAAFGRSQFSGQVQFAAAAGAPLRITLAGPRIDLSQRLAHDATPQASPKPEQEPDGPPWILDARFEEALMAHERVLDGVMLHAESDGHVVRHAHAQLGTAHPAVLEIVPTPDGRALNGTAEDAGELLRDFDLVDDMVGGHLTVAAHYDDRTPSHPLTGSAEITDFRMSKAPGLARLLQAMTLYGLVEVLQGPGLGFTRLVAPFRLSDDTLELMDARAFSSSLGLTAKGRLDLAHQTVDAQGTIVPAYFFNSLLGGLPVIGKLFSPEQGGGVFAATYRVRGPQQDPHVTVNPLAALTPGFLRGLFGGL